MANEDKPGGRSGKPGFRGPSRSGDGGKPRSQGFKGRPSEGRSEKSGEAGRSRDRSATGGEGGQRSGGYKGGPRGDRPGGRDGEQRSSGFKSRPPREGDAGRPRGDDARPPRDRSATGGEGGQRSGGYKGGPRGDRPAGRDGEQRSFGYKGRPSRDGEQGRSRDDARPPRDRSATGGEGGQRSGGYKGAPRGEKAGGRGEIRSHGFRDRPGGARGGDGDGRSRGFRDRPDGMSGRPPRDREPGEEPSPVAADAEPDRIAKYLARAGISSRRDVERMIEDGRVTLNGETLRSPAVNVAPGDTILVDGAPIPEIERTRLWLYHKPSGLVTTNRDPEGRPTVFENLPEEMPRVLSVGRLDINTEGLLLLTNDGGLARILELPQTGWLRRYRVRAHGKVEQKRLDELKNGIAVDGVFYGSVEAELEREQGTNVWITVGLREGKNREVKNILGALGLEVNRLIRISYGPFQLGELPEGAVQEIRGRTLRDQLGPTLIHEAGANFDAPVRKPFSNKPVRSEEGETRLVKVSRRGDWVSASPVRPERRGKPGDKRFDRDDALSRLDTKKPERGGGKPKRSPGSPSGESDKQRHGRASNVWMAPGARPQGNKPKPAPKRTDGPGRSGGGKGPRSKG